LTSSRLLNLAVARAITTRFCSQTVWLKDSLAPHRTFPGDRPSTTILHRRLDPFSLGRLIAMFEHKVFVQGAVWDIDSFDQWGVELGKELAVNLIPSLNGDTDPNLDVSTTGLISTIKELSA
jgi:glucose-6-phosphate isomerase